MATENEREEIVSIHLTETLFSIMSGGKHFIIISPCKSTFYWVQDLNVIVFIRHRNWLDSFIRNMENDKEMLRMHCGHVEI